MTLNRYIYARDNPMKLIDPNGHGWNPFSAITSAVSSAVSTVSSDISTVASDVSGGVSAAANAISTGASDLAGAASGAWNSLPPVDQELAILGIAAVATVVTVGIAAPVIGAAVTGEVAAEAATGLGVEAGADTAGGILSTVAANAGEGALVNGGVTLAKDVATGQSLSSASTWEDVGLSAALGAIGGSASGGLQGVGLSRTLTSRVVSNVLGGVTQSAVGAVIKRPSPGHVITDYGLDVAQGTGAGYLAYARVSTVSSTTFDFLQQFISSFN